MARTGCLIVILFGFASPLLCAPDMVPFAIPGPSNPQSRIALSSDPIGGPADRLVVRDGHFYRRDRRIRLWGVNLSFGANFPALDEAEPVAARLAAAGVNTVRFHHMDTADYPRGLWNRGDGKTIEPESLDRLDYFLNELAKRGIYADINLHVGRSHSRYLGLPRPNSDYDKIVNLFTPQLIEAQKEFARQILDHVNPYRKLRYADDPAIAVFEITNENSFFMWNGDEVLRSLPEYYAGVLGQQYNQWLRARYVSTDRLRSAWNKHAQPLGANLLTNGSLTQTYPGRSIPSGWNLEQHETAGATAKPATYKQREALAIEIAQVNSYDWHLQFNQAGRSLEKGKYYTVIFSAAAPAKKRISLVVGQAHDPWQNLGLSQSIDLTEDWKEYRFGFTANRSDQNARISFSVGKDTTAVYLADVRLCPGGQAGLADDESVEKTNIALFSDREVAERSLDRLRFLAETEKRFFDGMRDHLKKTLGTRALVTGTIVFGPLGMYAQSDMDFIDSHSYWQHPRFPNRPWDPADWRIDQKPMSDFPDQSRTFAIASEKLAGKPFTLTEYNHPAPLDSQAECVPMIASFASAQDWDGIWFYTYSHSGNDWNREHMSGFFDIDTNPSKWAFMQAGAMIFRGAGFEPFNDYRRIDLLDSADPIGSLAPLYMDHGMNMFGVLKAKGNATWQDMIRRRIDGTYPSAPVGSAATFTSNAPTSIDWPIESGRGVYFANGRCGYVLSGDSRRFDSVSKGRAAVTSPGFAVMTVTAMDQTELAGSKKVLVTACGRCENTGMIFSADRKTVGTNWGKAPVQIEPVTGWVNLPSGSWKCVALKPDGTSGSTVPVDIKDGKPVLRISGESKTMWYLLTR